jgi:hypothetical protein
MPGAYGRFILMDFVLIVVHMHAHVIFLSGNDMLCARVFVQERPIARHTCILLPLPVMCS